MGLKKEGDVSKEVAKEEPLMGMVAYTDGGARPSRGHAGWGAHGFLYNAVKPKKGAGIADWVVTSKGYISKEDMVKREIVFAEYTDEQFLSSFKNPQAAPLEVSPVHYFDGFGSFPYITTNNVAELTGAIQAMRHALQHPVSCLEIWTDSEYVRKGFEMWLTGWIKKNFIRPEPGAGEYANKEEWMELATLRDRLKERGVQVRINWVRGHDGYLGNTNADHAATAGVMQAMRNYTKLLPDSSKQGTMTIAKAEGYWKYDTERHPFIAHPNMYFNTQEDYARAGEYYFGTHGKDDDTLGKRIPEGSYAVVLLETPDPMLEMVRKFSCIYNSNEDSIAFLRLSQAFRPDIHRELTLFGEHAMQPTRGKNFDLESLSEEPLVTVMNPAMLARRAVDSITEMLDTLRKFTENDPMIIKTDITNILYETAEKPTKKGNEAFMQLKPEYNVGFAALEVIAAYQGDTAVQSAPVTLTLGIDLLGRNSLKRLETTNPKVTLITWLESKDAFRYATVIQSGKDIGIWAGYYSNLRIVAK